MIDPLDRRGSLQRPFVAALDQQHGVRVSDLILAPEPSKPEAALEPLIERTAARRVVAYLELYGDGAERWRDVVVRVDAMKEGEATPIIRAPAELSRPETGWTVARAVLPLNDLEPGRYIARAHVVIDGQALATVARPFSLVAR